MLKWAQNENLRILFEKHPAITERYICPCCSEDERKSILKKPYKNDENLKIEVEYFKKCKKYTFTIPKDYLFDGASIPRIFWRVIGSNTDNSFLIAAMVHDFLCENHSAIENDRYLSTLIFDSLLKVGGVGGFKRWCMKHSVDNYQKFCGWGK